jgi:hypothetical protein
MIDISQHQTEAETTIFRQQICLIINNIYHSKDLVQIIIRNKFDFHLISNYKYQYYYFIPKSLNSL